MSFEDEMKKREKVLIWDNKITTIAEEVTRQSSGKVKVINHMNLDRLINVKGKNRPIAVFVPTKSSSLSMSGVFVYDTRKLPDNTLYLFAGPDCPDSLIELADKLLLMMHSNKPAENIIRIIKTTEGDDFNRMIHAIGGHKSQIMPTEKSSDDLFFENVFFKSLLHITSFSNGESKEIKAKNIKYSDLPDKGAAIIDTSDIALYLWVPQPFSNDENEMHDVELATRFISENSAFNGREVFMFNPHTVPPNISIILPKV